MRQKLFYGWVIVLITGVSMVLIYGIRHSFSVFFAPILSEFGWSRGNVSIMLSLNIFFYGFMAPLAGFLVDRWPARKMMPLGILVLGLATAGCALADRLIHFYLLFGILVPLGSAFSGWPFLAPTLMQWFQRRRGLVLGLGMVGSGLSFAFTLFIEFSIQLAGWRHSFLILGALLVCLLLPLHYFFYFYRPSDKGLRAYGADGEKGTDLSQGGKSVTGYPKIREWTLREILRTRQLWLLVSSYALFWGVSGYMVMAHQVKFAQDVGFSSMFSVSVFAVFGVTLFLGQLSGFLSDWMGREKTVTAASVLSLCALLVLLSIRDASRPWLFYLYSLLFGYGCGLFTPAIQAAAADIFLGRYFGMVIGLLLTGMGVGGILGPWLGGYLFDITGNYRSAFILCMGSIILACLLIWLAAPRKAVSIGVKK